MNARLAVTLIVLLHLLPGAASVHAEDFTAVTYHTCYDGDTCTFTIPDVPEVFGQRIGVRLAGIDTAEMRAKCDHEHALAIQARDLVRDMLGNTSHITLRDVSRGKYFRVVATIEADGVNVSQRLLERGLAVPYDGGKKTHDWCALEPGRRQP